MSTELREIPSGGRVSGRVRVPPSKSVSHRQLNLALLGGSSCRVDHLLQADDLDHFVAALRTLGYSVDRHGGSVVLTPPVLDGGAAQRSGRIDCGNAGTLMRILAATLTTVPGTWMLDGSSRMRERPIGPLVEALRGLGAEIRYAAEEGYPPLDIQGGTLMGGSTVLDAGESSQYLSAVLMAALVAEKACKLEVTALISSPYVDITRRLVAQWGGVIRVEGTYWTVEPGLTPQSEATVEGDYSAAPYPASAAVLTGGEVLLEGLERDSAQGDRVFLDLLAKMGAGVAWQGDRVRVWADQPLQALDVDMSSTPDQVPTLAALAPFARGTTRIHNVPHLRIKECDRLAAMASELSRLGVPVVEHPAGLEIEGVWADTKPPTDRVVVKTYDDHRIAMALALVGLRRPGVVVADPGVVSKSYPEFWRDLENLLMGGGS